MVINDRTGVSMVTSKPSVWGGEKNDGIGAIAGGEGGMWNDRYSTPVDQIDSIEQLDRPFAIAETIYAIADKTSNEISTMYVCDDDDTNALEENAMKFQTRQDAYQYINDKGWQEWAIVVEL